jgi:hypothetical protein
VAFDAFALQRPVNPKPVETGLLYNDGPKALTCPQSRLLPKAAFENGSRLPEPRILVQPLPEPAWPFHSQQRVPRGLHGLDLFEKKFKSIQLMVDERF